MGSTAARKHLALKDLVNWFEIPAYDIHRAATFYNAIYNMEMEIGYNGDYAMAFFPAVKGVGGAVGLKSREYFLLVVARIAIAVKIDIAGTDIQ